MLIVRRDAGVVTLTLNRPGLGNALGHGLVEALIAETSQTFADASIHVLVLRAEGKHFCTGLDLSDLETASDGDLLLRLVRIETLLSMVWHAPIRTAVVAHGRTWGAGADLFAACEHRVARPDTTFRFPGAQFGIVLGARRLAERVGTDVARRVVLEGAELDAPQALQAGLVSVIGNAMSLPQMPVDVSTAIAVRGATRADQRDADLAALVRSAATPGLLGRIAAYRTRQLAARAG